MGFGLLPSVRYNPPMPVTFLSDSPEATQAWAAQLAAGLSPPLVIALYGDLGAGKTVLVKGFAAGLGVTVPVTSPTFTLINEYALPLGGTLYHADCYRLSERLDQAVSEARTVGLEELFDEGFVLIEWAERIQPLLPKARLDIELTGVAPGQRRIVLTDHRSS